MKNIYFIKEGGKFDKFEVPDNFPELPQFVHTDPSAEIAHPVWNHELGRWEEDKDILISELQTAKQETELMLLQLTTQLLGGAQL